MTRWMLATALIGLGVLRPGATAAQTMFLQVPAHCVESPCQRRLTVSLDPLQIAGDRLVPAGSFPTYVTPDGRLGVGLLRAGTAASAFEVSDFVSGVSFEVAVPGVSQFIGNPARAELYAADTSGALALSVAGVRRMLTAPCAPPGLTPVTISADGSKVAFRCAGLGPISVFDTASGALAGMLPALSALDADGTTAYVVSGSPLMLRRIEVATGAELAQVATAPGATAAGVLVDPRTGHVLLVESPGLGARLFAATLQLLRPVPSFERSGWTFDPSRPRAYAAQSSLVEGCFGCGLFWVFSLNVIDTDRWTVIGGGSTSAFNCCFAVAYAFPPAAPTGVAGSVSGSAVTLSWTAPIAAASVTRYVLEAGSGPGLANIATFDVGLNTSLAVGGVPPGTYYVRVRAVNYTGASGPSNEVVITVP